MPRLPTLPTLPTLAAIAAIATIALGGCSTVTEQSLTEKGVKPMTGAEMQVQYATRVRTLEWTNARNETGTIRYSPDGTAFLQWRGGNAQGRWRIDGDRFCTRYPDLRGNQETCSRIYRTADNEFTSFPPEGTARGRFID